MSKGSKTRYHFTCLGCGNERIDTARKLAYWWEDHMTKCTCEVHFGFSMGPVEDGDDTPIKS